MTVFDKKRREAVQNLARVIADEGRKPEYHREQIARIQKDWPLLWQAIQRVLRTHGEGR